ncbi:unnamed protein product [Dibothriocephalus latus]|uniref:Uncharacterized protein n=1 Tax=Dibothriocephalus latus TaxID=60516 RepID=A0A3P6UAT4_DIBLA|nr:unnamed protein product [Dibothriocephalus latus]
MPSSDHQLQPQHHHQHQQTQQQQQHQAVPSFLLPSSANLHASQVGEPSAPSTTVVSLEAESCRSHFLCASSMMMSASQLARYSSMYPSEVYETLGDLMFPRGRNQFSNTVSRSHCLRTQ